MQFQVPQFIETEDKIVGPFTLRQFLYIAAGGILSFILYFRVQTWLWLFLSIFILAISISFSFIKINGRPLANLFLSALSYYWKPQTYVWQPDNPRINKEEALRSADGGGFLESVVSGLVLKNAWRSLQTGTKQAPATKETKERYQIFQRISGERQVARRVDYR